MVPKIDHPSVVREQRVFQVNFPDLTVKRILIVEVNIPFIEDEPEFDADEFARLVDAIAKAKGDSIDCVEFRRATN